MSSSSSSTSPSLASRLRLPKSRRPSYGPLVYSRFRVTDMFTSPSSRSTSSIRRVTPFRTSSLRSWEESRRSTLVWSSGKVRRSLFHTLLLSSHIRHRAGSELLELVDALESTGRRVDAFPRLLEPTPSPLPTIPDHHSLSQSPIIFRPHRASLNIELTSPFLSSLLLPPPPSAREVQQAQGHTGPLTPFHLREAHRLYARESRSTKRPGSGTRKKALFTR